jgi:hypothetical protein
MLRLLWWQAVACKLALDWKNGSERLHRPGRPASPWPEEIPAWSAITTIKTIKRSGPDSSSGVSCWLPAGSSRLPFYLASRRGNTACHARMAATDRTSKPKFMAVVRGPICRSTASRPFAFRAVLVVRTERPRWQPATGFGVRPTHCCGDSGEPAGIGPEDKVWA